MKRHVITGGPGIGKTTVIELLASRGYMIVPEVARMITEEEKLKESGIVFWKDLTKYQEKIAERQMELESKATADIVFLDRSLIDGYAYCKLGNIAIPELVSKNGRNRYTKVFLLEPLPTYTKDETRFENQEEAARIHDEIIDAYKEFGYQTISVPALPPEERAEFIIGLSR